MFCSRVSLVYPSRSLSMNSLMLAPVRAHTAQHIYWKLMSMLIFHREEICWEPSSRVESAWSFYFSLIMRSDARRCRFVFLLCPKWKSIAASLGDGRSRTIGVDGIIAQLFSALHSGKKARDIRQKSSNSKIEINDFCCLFFHMYRPLFASHGDDDDTNCAGDRN